MKWLKESFGELLSVLLLVLIITFYPLIILFAYFSYFVQWRKGLNIRISEAGLIAYSKARGDVATYRWTEILSLSYEFKPPITYPVLNLHSGERVHLESASMESLEQEFEQRGLQVIRDLPED